MRRSWRDRARLALAYLAAAIAGVLLTWAFLRSPLLGQDLRAGPWRTSLVAGSPEADPYTRAKVARVALLALEREETLYYLAEHDSAGRALKSRCRYRVSGVAPQARWWSVTAYADDYFLFPDEQGRYSVSGSRAVLDAEGRFAFVSGPRAPADGAPWLPTPGDRGLVFALRLYHPAPSIAAAPQGWALPRIEALDGGCP